MFGHKYHGTLREQLAEAKVNISRQLEILQGPSTVVGKGCAPPNNRAIIANLEEHVREIDEALGNLGPHDA